MAAFLLGAAIISCNENGTNGSGHKTKLSATDSLINSGGLNATGPYAKGANLLATNDCITCHKVRDTMYGPSFQQIAEKYGFNAGNVDKLSDGIIHGSAGIWGTERRMAAHPNLSKPDAEEMVRYILHIDTTAK